MNGPRGPHSMRDTLERGNDTKYPYTHKVQHTDGGIDDERRWKRRSKDDTANPKPQCWNNGDISVSGRAKLDLLQIVAHQAKQHQFATQNHRRTYLLASPVQAVKSKCGGWIGKLTKQVSHISALIFARSFFLSSSERALRRCCSMRSFGIESRWSTSRRAAESWWLTYQDGNDEFDFVEDRFCFFGFDLLSSRRGSVWILWSCLDFRRLWRMANWRRWWESGRLWLYPGFGFCYEKFIEGCWRWLKNWGWRNGREEESGREPPREGRIHELYRAEFD